MGQKQYGFIDISKRKESFSKSNNSKGGANNLEREKETKRKNKGNLALFSARRKKRSKAGPPEGILGQEQITRTQAESQWIVA